MNTLTLIVMCVLAMNLNALHLEDDHEFVGWFSLLIKLSYRYIPSEWISVRAMQGCPAILR